MIFEIRLTLSYLDSVTKSLSLLSYFKIDHPVSMLLFVEVFDSILKLLLKHYNDIVRRELTYHSMSGRKIIVVVVFKYTI